MAIFKTGKDDATRLQAIQDFTDRFTHEGIAALDLPANAACLEVGAGGGSIARWLVDQFPAGSVEAVDIDVSLLNQQVTTGLSVIESDICEADYPAGSFDLIHARFVLSHLPNRDELITRFVSWLRPGGYLVVTDPYQLPPAKSPHKIVARVFGAYVDFVEGAGMDLEWVRAVPSLYKRAGLSEVSHISRTTFLGGGEDDRWAPLIASVEEPLLAAGVTEGELTEFFGALQDPEVMDIPQIIITVTGRKG